MFQYANPVNVFVAMTGNTLLFACLTLHRIGTRFSSLFLVLITNVLAKKRLSARNFVDRLAWFLYRCLAGILCAADREYASVSNSICVCTIRPSLPFQLALIEFRFVFLLCFALLCLVLRECVCICVYGHIHIYVVTTAEFWRFLRHRSRRDIWWWACGTC